MARLASAGTSVLFSGDLGRPLDPLMPPPAAGRRAEYLVLESTYGNRRHRPGDPKAAMAEVINRTVNRGGVVIVPSFAVGRAQVLLYYLHLLKSEKAIPDIPVFLNSPMAIDATDIFARHVGEHRLTATQCRDMCAVARYVNTVDESKMLNTRRSPMIVIAGSGMATGGRVLHHLKAYAPDPANTILFTGYQAGGTRGAALVGGAESIKIHGEYVPVRAEVALLDQMSGHADCAEILDWLQHYGAPPRAAYITHGEPAASDALRLRIEEGFRWNCAVPEYLQKVALA
jgi:metallo-beta-lactamase family protein